MTPPPRYPAGTLGAALLAHDNDYRLDADMLAGGLGPAPRCTVVIPYYEASRTVAECVEHLLQATAVLRAAAPAAAVQIVVVDDGSVDAPAAACLQRYVSAGLVEVLTSGRNGGRANARNEGLQAADHSIVVFVDADVLVHPQTLVDHMRVHGALAARRPITAGLFRFFLGPWTIANMVLGGLFACDRDLARSCDGFDAINGPYGFVETTLVTKLIARTGCPVVPLAARFSLHIDDRTVAIPRARRDELYREAHRRFFGAYLHRRAD